MEHSEMLRKGIIRDQLSIAEFIVEDIFSKEMIRMKLSGKQRMYADLAIGDEVYVTLPPYTYDLNKGRWTTSTDFKMNNGLFGLKLDLDLKVKNLKKD